MQEYFIELSKYLITICMALYAFECFHVFRYRKESERHGIYVRQNVLMFVIQLLCYLNLILVSKDLEYLFYYLFVQVFLVAALVMAGVIYEKINRLLLNNMCMLLSIGFCMIARLSFNKGLRQYVIALASLAGSLLIPYLMYKMTFLRKMTWVYAAVGILLLSIVLILGEVTYGSKRAFTVGGFTLQPSEFVKIIFIFFLAGALKEEPSFKRVALTTLLSGIQVVILVASKDLGSALIFFIGFIALVFIATRNYWYLLAGVIGGCVAAYASYLLFAHVRVRVLAWRDPWTYIDNEGYQITQSLFAIGNGSWFGTGLMQGNPKAIPFVDADFMFSAICEELGVIFGVCLILVCLSCFVVIMDISVRLKDKFYQLTAYGLGVIYIFQVFLTIGGGIKFIPLTGITLPLVSYGGSSILTTMVMFFVVQGLYMKLQQEGDKKLDRKSSKAAKESKERPEKQS